MRIEKPDPKRAVAYIRVSKDDQKLGPEAQQASIEAWAKREGIVIVGWGHDIDVCSVTPIEDRPGLSSALESMRTERAGVLIVAKRDRIARDIVLAAIVDRMCERMGAAVVSCANEGNGAGPEATLMRTIIDAFSQYERALIRSRTKAALAVKIARGDSTGMPPYGFSAKNDPSRKDANGKPVKVLVADPDEQAAIARTLALYREGMSEREIVDWLGREGFRSRQGTWLQKTQVHRIIKTHEARP